MKYKIKYSDDFGEGITIIHSNCSLSAAEAASLIKEQLEENGIEIKEVFIEEFRQINNCFDWIQANFQRLWH